MRVAPFAILLYLAAPGLPAAEPAPGLIDALVEGEIKLSLRYRYEGVDDDAFAREAEASTLRTRLGYRSAGWKRWSLGVEADDVRAIGAERFDSTRNGVMDRPVVADPEGTEINVALLEYTGDRYSLALGRQRMNLDDQRFVGSNGWRQNEQTFDAAALRARWPAVDAQYSFVGNVNRSFGPENGTPPADLRGDLHLFNARIDARAAGAVTVFAYLLDFDEAPAFSLDTVGLRWTGSLLLPRQWRFQYAASYARQQDAGDNPADVDADYRFAEAGLRWRQWTLAVGRELLGGEAARVDGAFQTPIGTLHLFQGQADKLATTPPAGIDDRYATLRVEHGDFRAQFAWHDFDAEATGEDFGQEWDATLSYNHRKRFDVLLKAAVYSSDGFAGDTTKLWLQLTASF